MLDNHVKMYLVVQIYQKGEARFRSILDVQKLSPVGTFEGLKILTLYSKLWNILEFTVSSKKLVLRAGSISNF